MEISQEIKVTVSSIIRTDRQRCAIKIRELAARIESGKIAYATIFAVNLDGSVDEFVMTGDESLNSEAA